MTEFKGLTGNQLKIIALISMTLDHVGVELLPQFEILRIIGRIAFPIFAFMISEGCRYTKNRKKYLLLMSSLAVIFQIVYFVATRSLYQCVLVTFSFAIGLIYIFDYTCKRKSFFSVSILIFYLCALLFVCRILPLFLIDFYFSIDYGFFGILLPLCIYIGKTHKQKLVMLTVGLIILAIDLGDFQPYSLITVCFLALYNGKRGKRNMKYLFYFYYPLHLIIIYAVGFIPQILR